MTKEELQAKHRLEEAQARNRQKERKARTRMIIPHSGKHESAGRKTSIRGAENDDSRKERSNSPKERISCRI